MWLAVSIKYYYNLSSNYVGNINVSKKWIIIKILETKIV